MDDDEAMQEKFNSSRRTNSIFLSSQLKKIKTELAEKAKIFKASPKFGSATLKTPVLEHSPSPKLRPR